MENLHQILRELYLDMLPLCGHLISIAKGIAGLGALFYIASRVWQSLARNEPIDVYPLLRPFGIGICIILFSSLVLGSINGILSPVVVGTHQMLAKQTLNMQEYQNKKDKLEAKALKSNSETAYLVDNQDFDNKLKELGWSPKDLTTMAGMHVERGMYKMREHIRKSFREFLEMLFQSAALIIDVIRTFFLIVLSILGPLAFALSVWDGFQSTLTQWIARYITVYLWLPVSDLFSAVLARIQTRMLMSDIDQLEQNITTYSMDNSNVLYIIFMLIGIIGYFTIPTVSGWIIQAGGMGNYGRNLNQAAHKAGSKINKGLNSANRHITNMLQKR